MDSSSAAAQAAAALAEVRWTTPAFVQVLPESVRPASGPKPGGRGALNGRTLFISSSHCSFTSLLLLARIPICT